MTAEAPVAVVLAAGVGRRLGNLTASRPKALIELGGVPLLERALQALESAGFGDALVVTGHAAAEIDKFLETRAGLIRTRTLFNPRYADTNNIMSLLAASDALDDGFCLLNSDIIFDHSLVSELSLDADGVWLIIDHDEPLGAEEMKVEVDESGVIRRISKSLDPLLAAGEYIGLARFDAPGAQTVLDAARTLVAGGGTHLYYEDAIDHSAARLGARIRPTSKRLWAEIDDLADYSRAQRLALELDGTTADE